MVYHKRYNVLYTILYGSGNAILDKFKITYSKFGLVV
jgi:hypothetical protein